MGELFRRTWILIQRNGKASAIAVAILTPVLGFFGPGIIGLATMVYAQYELTYSALARIDLLDSGYRGRRFVAVGALLLLNYLIIVAGLFLLVVPGIILAARLIASVPALIAEETGVFEALKVSWVRTRSNTLSISMAIAALLAVGFAVLVALSFGIRGAVDVLGSSSEAVSTVALLGLGVLIFGLLAAMLVTYWHMAVAVYAGSRSEQDIEDVAHIFA